MPYVLGGTDANPGEFPHQAVFSYERSGKTISCGASIIHPLLLLTAAHCVYGNINPETVSAFTGEQDRRQHEGTEQSHPVRSIIVHEQFNTSTLDNDVAILVLQNPIKLTNFTKIIRTASPDERVPGRVEKNIDPSRISITLSFWLYNVNFLPYQMALMLVGGVKLYAQSPPVFFRGPGFLSMTDGYAKTNGVNHGRV